MKIFLLDFIMFVLLKIHSDVPSTDHDIERWFRYDFVFFCSFGCRRDCVSPNLFKEFATETKNALLLVQTNRSCGAEKRKKKNKPFQPTSRFNSNFATLDVRCETWDASSWETTNIKLDYIVRSNQIYMFYIVYVTYAEEEEKKII